MYRASASRVRVTDSTFGAAAISLSMAASRWCRVPTCVDVRREETLCARGGGSPSDRVGADRGIGGREPQAHVSLPQHAYMRRDQAHGGRGGRLRRRGIGIRRRGRDEMTVPPRLCRPGPPSLAGGAQCTRSTFLARATFLGGLSAGR